MGAEEPCSGVGTMGALGCDCTHAEGEVASQKGRTGLLNISGDEGMAHGSRSRAHPAG